VNISDGAAGISETAARISETVARVEQDLLRRKPGSTPDLSLLHDIAGRLEALMAKLRALDLTPLRDVPPSTSYSLPRQAELGPARLSPQDVRALAGPGGTGYASLPHASPGPAPGRSVPEAPTSWAVSTSSTTPAVGVVPPPVQAGDPLASLSAVDLAAAIRRKEISPVEAVEAALARIASLDGDLRAFVTITGDQAITAARQAEQAIARGEPVGPLHGVPVAVKDIFEIAGLPTTAGSRVLAGYISQVTATAVERLLQAGAIVVGKTATHEFAFGVTTDTPFHGPVHNPWALDRVPGGSSGGSGAAVAARVVPVALGTDTGGSVRIPAALCGTVGLKPTFGRVSKYGVIPLAWSQDHVGVLSSSIEDAALFLRVLAGPDPRDPSTLEDLPDDFLRPLEALAVPGAGATAARNWAVGVPFRWLEGGRVDSGIMAAFRTVLGRLETAGIAVRDVDLPPAEAMAVINRFISLSEGAAYHSDTLAERPEDFSPAVRARFELGQFLLAKDYITMQRLRGEMARLLTSSLRNSGAAVLLLPTTPIPAPLIGQQAWSWPDGPEPVPDALIRFTAPFSLTGHPAVSIPAGLVPAPEDDRLLPWGLQVVGLPLQEVAVLAVARALTDLLPRS